MASLFPLPLLREALFPPIRNWPPVDRSVRWPVMLCFLTGVHRMVVGTVLLGLRLVADTSDRFIAEPGHAHRSLKQLQHVHLRPPLARPRSTALVYGWGGCAGLGLAAWLLARMSREPVHSPGALITAIIFWNLGVAGGLTGIFIGQSTSVELL